MQSLESSTAHCAIRVARMQKNSQLFGFIFHTQDTSERDNARTLATEWAIDTLRVIQPDYVHVRRACRTC